MASYGTDDPKLLAQLAELQEQSKRDTKLMGSCTSGNVHAAYFIFGMLVGFLIGFVSSALIFGG